MTRLKASSLRARFSGGARFPRFLAAIDSKRRPAQARRHYSPRKPIEFPTFTVHSLVGKNPEEHGIRLKPLPPICFANNDVEFVAPIGVYHDRLGQALNKAP